MIAPLVIFALTYVAISVRRIPGVPLGRPAAALCGAVAMVLWGGVSLDRAYAAVHWDTIALLLGMMILTGYLQRAGVLSWLAYKTVTRAGSPRALLVLVVLVCGLLSAFLVNDTVCLIFAPFVIAVCEEAKLPRLPFLLAVGMASNVGGVATFTGTPQTMMIGGLSGLSYARYAAHLAPPALIGLVVLSLILGFAFRRELTNLPLESSSAKPPVVDSTLAIRAIVVIAGVIVAFFAGVRLAGAAMTGAAALLLVAGRDARPHLEKVDWTLLLFFAGLFIVMDGVSHTGVAEELYERLSPAFGASEARQLVGFGAFSVLASNLVSNVPYVLIASHWIGELANVESAWYVLALTSTFAGNLTILGSVANLIVIELAGDKEPIGFWQFAKYGVPVTVATVGAGLGWLWVMA